MGAQCFENCVVALGGRELHRIVPVEVVHRDRKLWRGCGGDCGHRVAADCGCTQTDEFCEISSVHKTEVSRYSPQTRRKRLLISPTVAYASTHSSMCGRRFSLVAAACSSLFSVASVARGSRRARNARKRSICVCSSAGSTRNNGTAGSASI